MLQELQGQRGLHIAFDHVPRVLPEAQLKPEAVYVRCEPRIS
jgi:hypothetical protein